jgi:hypothetical protein
MNGATRDIADLLEISLTEALEVQSRIDEEDLLDWSECTTSEFHQAARVAHTLIKEGH